MAYKPGQSGNPAGRPKGIPDRRNALREVIGSRSTELVQRCVDLALAGDPAALRICMDRLVAPLREERLSIELPRVTNAAECAVAQAEVVDALARGDLLPSQAQVVSSLIDAQRRAIETSDIVERLARLEERMNLSNTP